LSIDFLVASLSPDSYRDSRHRLLLRSVQGSVFMASING